MSKTMRDLQWSFISIAVSSLFHLLLRIVLGRELGAAGLGLYTLVFTIYTFGMQFAAFGIGAALTKYIAEHNENLGKVKELVSSGLTGSFISGSIMGFVLYLLSNVISNDIFHNPEMVYMLKITAFSFPFIALQKTVLGTLNGMRRMNYFAFINIVQNILVLFISFALVIFFKLDVFGAVLGFVAPTILTGLLSLIFIKDLFKIPCRLFNSDLRELSWFGFYVVLANSIGVVNTQIDSFLVGFFMNEVEVGYYAVAIIFMNGMMLIPSSIQLVTTPKIASYYGKKDYKSIRYFIKGIVLKVFLITIFISIILVVFGKFLISIIFTAEFLPAYKPMLILLIVNLAYAPIVSINGWFSSTGRIKLIFKFVAFSSALNILLNILLIPKFGIIGAATATAISLLTMLIIEAIIISKNI